MTLPANAFLNYKSPFRAGRIDWIRSAPEGGPMDPGTKFLSGSVLRQGGKDVNVPVPCKPTKCRHMEYVNIPGVPDVQGNRWEVGPDHWVKGGFGFLAVGPLGMEPTGRLVVQGLDGPAAIKIVLVKVDEKTDTAIFQGYGRYCVRKIHKGWISCTAFVNPLPMFFSVKRGLIMPVDIRISGNMPNPLALGKEASQAQASFTKRIRQGLVSQGISIASGAIGSGGGGSGGGSAVSGGGSSVAPKTVKPLGPKTPSSKPRDVSGSKNDLIYRTALDYRGYSSAAGPVGGREACAWMVNKVLYATTGRQYGSNPNYVPYVEDDFRSGSAIQVSRSRAKAGDIIIAKDMRHIGICMTDGCTQTLSNSSSRARFSWQSDSTFEGVYDRYGGTEHFYRLK
jgi:uncharacterized membrane protein YgcG